MKRMPTWIIKDNEVGKLRRFNCNTDDPDVALRAYLRWLNPYFTNRDIDQIAVDFNGEIWRETDIEYIGLGKAL